MFDWLRKVCSCGTTGYTRMTNSDSDDEVVFKGSSIVSSRDPLVWSRELEKHCYGEFSYAIAQGNNVIEDHSQVEIGRDSTFVGVFDGHGGPEASRYTLENFFTILMNGVKDNNGNISEEKIRNAVSQTENGFTNFVRNERSRNELIVASGSCFLAGLVWKGTLYTANLGDSRAVLGVLDERNRIVAQQLTRDDNTKSEEVRKELKDLHPDDPLIVFSRNGAYRVKGIIQVSKAIGDLYLKSQEFAVDSKYPRFYLPEPIVRPLLSTNPIISRRILQPNDRFLILASDGLWEHLDNQQAVDIVHRKPRPGIARRLVVKAQTIAARKISISYDELMKVDRERRRRLHDDITVVVIFFDEDFNKRTTTVQEFSVKGYSDSDVPSKFQILQENRIEGTAGSDTPTALQASETGESSSNRIEGTVGSDTPTALHASETGESSSSRIEGTAPSDTATALHASETGESSSSH